MFHKKLVNCFKKAGISSENQVRSQSDDDGPFKLLVLDAQLKDFQDKHESPLGDFTVDGYVDVDEDVLLSCAELWGGRGGGGSVTR